MKGIRFFLVLMFLLGFSSYIFADGMVIIDPRPGITSGPMIVKTHEVTVEIREQTAVTTVDQIFVNQHNKKVEGTYIFPLPAEAVVTEFAFFVDGKKIKGEVLEKNEANKIYQDLVRKAKQPGLLEYIGRNLFRAKLGNIKPNEEKRVVLKYAQTFKMERNIIRYSYPLNVERFSPKPLEICTIDLDIRSQIGISNVYSSTHKITSERKDKNHYLVHYGEEDVLPEQDFDLFISYEKADFGLNILSYKEKGENGYFLAMISPSFQIKDEKVLDKDIIFVIDISGSMREEKIEQAKNALEFCIENLNKGDNFNILAFETQIHLFRKNLVSVENERKNGLSFVKDLSTGGGTNIGQALTKALSMFKKSQKLQMIVFLTDGEPTAGERNPGKIVSTITKKNENVRVFVFGVGYNLDTNFLDKLAELNHGTADYIEPEESIEEKISNFYTKISNPVLSNISLDWKGVSIDYLYPTQLPDIFSGTQLILTGRYKNSGKAKVILTGYKNNEKLSFDYAVEFAKANLENDFIPSLWATRRIGYLLSEIKLGGEKKELVDEVIELSKEYAIATPYTSFLVREEKEAPIVAGAPMPMGEGSGKSSGVIDKRVLQYAAKISSIGETGSGKADVKASKNIAKMKSSQQVIRTGKLKKIKERTFSFDGKFWVQMEYKDQKLIKIKFNSDKYFDLLLKDPVIKDILSLGKNVIFLFDGKWYRIYEG